MLRNQNGRKVQKKEMTIFHLLNYFPISTAARSSQVQSQEAGIPSRLSMWAAEPLELESPSSALRRHLSMAYGTEQSGLHHLIFWHWMLFSQVTIEGIILGFVLFSFIFFLLDVSKCSMYREKKRLSKIQNWSSSNMLTVT